MMILVSSTTVFFVNLIRLLWSIVVDDVPKMLNQSWDGVGEGLIDAKCPFVETCLEFGKW